MLLANDCEGIDGVFKVPELDEHVAVAVVVVVVVVLASIWEKDTD